MRKTLHQSFRSLVASPSGEAKAPVPDHEDNWEAKGSRMALQLEDLQKSFEVKMHDIKLNRVGVATPNVMPAQESSSVIRQEIDALLEKFGEEYGKEHGESIETLLTDKSSGAEFAAAGHTHLIMAHPTSVDDAYETIAEVEGYAGIRRPLWPPVWPPWRMETQLWLMQRSKDE